MVPEEGQVAEGWGMGSKWGWPDTPGHIVGRAGRGGTGQGRAGGQFGKLGVPTDRYLVESFQKCFWLGQRWKGGSYHLEGPRWRRRGRCGLRDHVEGWWWSGGLMGSLARWELELEVRGCGDWHPGGRLRGGGHSGGGGRGRREVGGWGQWALRGLGWGPQRGLGWAWGRGGWGAGWWWSTQLILDHEDTRQSWGTLGLRAGVQGGLHGWAGQALGLGWRA